MPRSCHDRDNRDVPVISGNQNSNLAAGRPNVSAHENSPGTHCNSLLRCSVSCI
jgi:hypothetical protein